MKTLVHLNVFSQQITFLKFLIKITNKTAEQKLVQNFDPPSGIIFVAALKEQILTLIWIVEDWRNFSNLHNSPANVSIFFLAVFSFTSTDNSQNCVGRKWTIFFSHSPLPPAQKHSALHVITKLLLTEI